MQRYDRNILIEKIGKDGQKKLLDSKVLIAGAGGLGATVIANLAALGVGTLGIVDNDVIELSNLNRQYIHKTKDVGMSKVESAKKWIEELNSDIKVNAYQLRINEENHKSVTKDYDLIIDCFDSYKSKFLLNKIAVKSAKTVIHCGVS